MHGTRGHLLQVLYGDVAGAMETWELLRALAVRNHGLIPEIYNRDLSARDLHYYLRCVRRLFADLTATGLSHPWQLVYGRDLLRSTAKEFKRRALLVNKQES